MSAIFSQILGHQNILRQLFQVVDRGALAPVLLFVGAPGIGKGKVALALTQYLVCQAEEKPCGQCGPCMRVEKGQSESLLFVQPEGQQIKIDQAHEILRFCQLSHLGRARVVIIDQVEKLNVQAANTLLKLLEEPPKNTHFFLLAPSLLSVMSTIRSRSQVVRLSPIPLAELRRKVQAPDWIIESSEGRFDRIETLQSEEVLKNRKEALKLLVLARQTARDPSRATVVEAIKDMGLTREQSLWVAKFWREFLRDVWLQKDAVKPLLHPDLSSELNVLTDLSYDQLRLGSHAVEQLDRDLRSNADIQLAVEGFLRGFMAEVQVG